MNISDHYDMRIQLIFSLVILFIFPKSAFSQDLTLKTWINPADSMEFVLIPSGHFKVEDPSTGKKNVFIHNFFVAKYEVSVQQFSYFTKSTGYITDAEKDKHPFNWRNPGFEQSHSHPVVYISYNDALNYANWAGVEIPFELEWLYACASGTNSKYYWGNDIDNKYLWHRENSSTGTKHIGTKLPNRWGLYDMVGNVWEYAVVSDSVSIPRGGSWTRCPVYQSRSGTLYEGIYHSIKPVLTAESSIFGIEPYDDDRGFRCIKRIGPLETSP